MSALLLFCSSSRLLVPIAMLFPRSDAFPLYIAEPTSSPRAGCRSVHIEAWSPIRTVQCSGLMRATVQTTAAGVDVRNERAGGRCDP